MTGPIFKILSASAWADAMRDGVFRGAPVDLADGYIHFSTAAQARETAAKHFAGQTGLVLVALDPVTLGDKLVWEPSRGGALFPHLYGPLDPALVLSVTPLLLDASGQHLFPDGIA